ncbi:MAG: DMT family transporter [Candidatus Cloacimonetes bacterium]|nr:DMT family transporter [Candidatus Cloacimonadota bacterium]
MNDQKKAYSFAVLAVILWSTVASAFKISLRHVDYLELLLFASFFSTFIIFIVLLIRKELHLIRTYSKKDLLFAALLGFLNPFLYYIVLFKAYSILPAQEAITLNYTWPLMLVLLSIPLLKQKIKFLSIVAIIISFIGVIIIATKGDIASLEFSNIRGDLLPLGSAVIWALFWIFNVKDKHAIVIKLFVSFCFGLLFSVVLLLVRSLLVGFSFPNLKGILGSAYVGFFEMGLTFIVWLSALKYAKTTAQVSNFIYITPFLSLFVVSIVVGERILLSTIIGLIFVIAGIILQRYTNPLKRDLRNGQKGVKKIERI